MKNTTAESAIETKPHYEILDGLRGVAAALVVAYHLFETYSGVSVSGYLIAVAVAYAALKLYDLPVRKWLARGLKK